MKRTWDISKSSISLQHQLILKKVNLQYLQYPALKNDLCDQNRPWHQRKPFFESPDPD